MSATLTDEPIETATPPAPVVPNRANAPVSETTERFLRAVIAQVPVDRIEELHLFSPLRQGAVETGIAVIAARRIVATSPEVEIQLPLDEQRDEGSVESPGPEGDAESIEQTPDSVPDAPNAPDTPVTPVIPEPPSSPDSPDAPDSPSSPDAPGEPETPTQPDTPTLPDLPDVPNRPDAPQSEHTADAPVERHTVYTARYRLVIKGPERGKWEADVVEEADAPLVTVETVVRGVQRRAGEDSDIVRYNGAQLSRVLRLSPPAEQA